MQKERLAVIRRASIIAICVNIALGIFKAIIGTITRSVAITLDAVNNFTDAGSSLITALAAVFSAKPADRKHPFGYGRTEYLGTLLIGGLIFYAGVSALIEAIDKILHPEMAEYSAVMLGILVAAVFAKLALTMYLVRTGKRVRSDSMIAAGKESAADIAVSVATLLAALLYMFFGVSVEAWLAAVIALVIIKSGIETLKETISNILGTSAEASLVRDMKRFIGSFDHVHGAYDLVLHNYGPDAYIGSVHVAVEDTMTMEELDVLTRTLETEVAEKFNVVLNAVSIYSINTKDPQTIQMREEMNHLMMENDYVNQMHGFYLNRERKEIRFDLVISFKAPDREAVYRELVQKARDAYPDYRFTIAMDTDFNEVE